jgi:predicted dinucleotide-binding enzyme
MKIGFIGAGNVGRNLARLLTTHGYDVIMSN